MVLVELETGFSTEDSVRLRLNCLIKETDIREFRTLLNERWPLKKVRTDIINTLVLF